ncbi:hypothetical protein QAD02_023468 [Eretmocerus hayati]|uniref:Uncharacterized protein n=1 Tax=Eretmocerus hayati TaxID=131215 RepID=A0ACC2PWK9_9HYME|nr:hypothetical protein QAD02_023468 [Eretmocerus hayati]
MSRFVVENIGFGSITRDEFIDQHATDFANHLYNDEPNVRKAIIIVDGTHSYIHKSSNFRTLRQTYCRHKGRHLLKPALIVAPDGHILYIQDPYFSDARNNNAAMLRDELEDPERPMSGWVQEGDIVLCDRGNRDVLRLLAQMDLITRTPALLDAGERQLSTEDANESRKVTKMRWIVEARNGHIKSIFQFLNQTMQIQHCPNLGDFNQIAGALINGYHPPLLMEGADAAMAGRMLQRANEPNELQARVETENLATSKCSKMDQTWCR